MTTLALVAGMIPLVISTGAGAATNRSIGVLVAGGQTLCLLLTLLAVPVFYSLWEDLGQSFAGGRLSRWFGRKAKSVQPSPAPVRATVFQNILGQRESQ